MPMPRSRDYVLPIFRATACDRAARSGSQRGSGGSATILATTQGERVLLFVGGVDSIEPSEQTRPGKCPACSTRRGLRLLLGALDDPRVDGDELASALRSNLNRARRLEEVHEDERIGD